MRESLRLLVVDDDEVDRLSICRALRSAGVRALIREEQNEVAAIAALSECRYDCAFLDYRLGAGDGLSVLAQIRSKGIKTPVVVLTGYGDEQIAVELMKAGASDYLSKEKLSPDSLNQALRHALQLDRIEREATRAHEALHLLAQASALLTTSLDFDVTLHSVARLLVPRLADYCRIDTIESDGSGRQRVIIHVDQRKEAVARELASHFSCQPDAPYGYPGVLRTGQSELCSTFDPRQGPQVGRNPESIGLLQTLNVTSYLCVPLQSRNQLLGAITLAITSNRPHYDASDLALAEELAHRAASALDNARLYREAQEAIRMRDAFLSIASHELKAPLTTLAGHADLLLRRVEQAEGTDAREQRSIRIVAEQARRLDALLESLLDLSRIEAGQLHIDCAPLDLGALARRLVTSVQQTLAHHLIHLALPPTPLIIHGDALRLEQVLHNLLQNAIKYSPDGGPIEVQVESGESEARITVADQGIGVPPEALPHLFDRFFRARSAPVQKTSGMGLGLFVVKEVVSLHGGKVAVESQEGRGTTFTIRLPLRPP